MVESCCIRRCEDRGDTPTAPANCLGAHCGSDRPLARIAGEKAFASVQVTAGRGMAWSLRKFNWPPEDMTHSMARAIKEECHCMVCNDAEHGL